MAASDDMQLLQEYADGNSEEAFSALVSRHINLVYSAAMRSVNNPHQAQEITQAVFVILARKSRGLRRGTILSGWLYQTARLTAANFARSEGRRQRREQQAHMQSTLNDPEPDVWRQCGPLLDQAMAELNEKDRNAIVLRFFEGKPLKDVGQALGMTEDAAKMRVSRALDKLRGIFLKRGITVPVAALMTAITENSIQAAPVDLAASVASGVFHGAALSASTAIIVKGTIQAMTWTKVTLAAGVGAAAIIVLQCQQISIQKQRVEQLEQQIAQQNRAQQAAMQKIEEQNSLLAKTMESTTSGLATARGNAGAARPVRAAPPVPKAAAESSPIFDPKALAKMMKDPAMREIMRAQTVAVMKMQYGPLIKQLNLGPDQTDKFYQLLVDSQMNNTEKSFSMMSGGSSTNGAEPFVDQKKQLDADVQSLLGDDGYTQYTAYQKTIADQTQLNQIKNDFSDNPLTDDQQQRLLQVMITARQNSSGNLPDTSQMNTTDKMAMAGQILQQQEQINQQVLMQAAEFLSPDQIQTLGTSQSNILNMQKVGMTMAQKMFGAQSNSAQ